MSEKARRLALVAAPGVLLVTTYVTYQQAVSAFGAKLGYLAGFLFYWIVWCLGFPLWLLGRDGVLALFRDLTPRFTSRRWLGMLCLLVPLLLAYGYEFPRALPQATVPIVLTSAVISVVNGIAEELLWRGTYAHVFAGNVWWGYLYPTGRAFPTSCSTSQAWVAGSISN
jgi:uncharacterized protein